MYNVDNLDNLDNHKGKISRGNVSREKDPEGNVSMEKGSKGAVSKEKVLVAAMTKGTTTKLIYNLEPESAQRRSDSTAVSRSITSCVTDK